MSQLNFTEVAASTIPTPPAGVNSFFTDSADHLYKWRDSSGVLHVVADTNSNIPSPLNLGAPRTTSAELNVEAVTGGQVGVTLRGKASQYVMIAPGSLSGLTVFVDPNVDGNADGASITSYTELSSNAIAFSQATGSKKPTKKATGANGKGAWSFIGANSQELDSTSAVSNSTISPGNAVTVIVITKNNPGTFGSNHYGAFGLGPWTDPKQINLLLDHDGISRFAYGADQLQWTTPKAFFGNYQIMMCDVDPSTHQLRMLMNGAVVATLAGGTGFTSTGTATMYLGTQPATGDYLDGSLAKVIVYNRKLSSVEFTGVYNWCANEIGVPMIESVQTSDMIDFIDDSGAIKGGVDSIGKIKATNITSLARGTNNPRLSVPLSDAGGSIDSFVSAPMPFHIVCGMDSLTDGSGGTATNPYVYSMRKSLKNLFGDGGPGVQFFDGESATSEALPVLPVLVTDTGFNYLHTLATTLGWGLYPQAYSLSGQGITFSAATGVGSYTWDPGNASPFTKVRIIYLQKPTGGTFNCGFTQAEKNTWQSVNTAGPLSLQYVEFSVINNLTSITMDTITGDVTLFAGWFFNNRSGICISKAAHTVDGFADHIQLDATFRSLWMAMLRPDYYILNAGVNDRNAIAAATYQTYIHQWISDVKRGFVNIGIQLMNPMQTSDYITSQLPLYKEALIAEAISNNCGYQDSVNAIGTYAVANANGLMLDGIHTTDSGATWVANDVVKWLGAYEDQTPFLKAPNVIDQYRYPDQRDLFPQTIDFPAAVGTAVKILEFGLPVNNTIYFELDVVVNDANSANKTKFKIWFSATNTSTIGKVTAIDSPMFPEIVRLKGIGHLTSMFATSITANNRGLLTITPSPNTVYCSMSGKVKDAINAAQGPLIYQV